jgi:uncharacterized protein YcbK (DUF882 family)
VTAHAVATMVATLVLLTTTRTLGVDAVVPRNCGKAGKKSAVPLSATDRDPLSPTPAGAQPVTAAATLVQTHTSVHRLLDDSAPTALEFSDLLTDRATGSRIDLDPRLLGLLRTIAAQHPGARIELVSGFRSPKLNEMMRKKGHNVASHSQHSLGHAVDFRVIPREALAQGIEGAIAPKELEKAIRATGWEGGVGTYPKRSDWFVHADVGRNRKWGE